MFFIQGVVVFALSLFVTTTAEAQISPKDTKMRMSAQGEVVHVHHYGEKGEEDVFRSVVITLEQGGYHHQPEDRVPLTAKMDTWCRVDIYPPQRPIIAECYTPNPGGYGISVRDHVVIDGSHLQGIVPLLERIRANHRTFSGKGKS